MNPMPLTTSSLFGVPATFSPPADGQLASTLSTQGQFKSMLIGPGVDVASPANILSGPDSKVGLIDGSQIASAPFADLVTNGIGQVEALEKQAKYAVEGLMSGRGVDVHEAMIATEKAEMSFELMLSVRSKALAAYQQVIGMQF